METLTIRPRPVASMSGVTSRATRKYPVRLVSTTARKPSGLTCQNPCGSVMNRGLTVRMPSPALLTSRSMPPSRPAAAWTAADTDASSRVSRPSPNAPGRVAATCSARPASRPVSTTLAPAWASADAMARPSPLVPPVSSTRRATISAPESSLSAMPACLSERTPGQRPAPGRRNQLNID